MDVIFMDCSSKERDGVKKLDKYKILGQNNYIQVIYFFILGLPMMLMLP